MTWPAAYSFAQNVAPTDPLPPAEEQKKFHLPPGFEIQLFASEPEIHKPINMTFDHAGRLFVSETVEYPFPAKDPATARDGIKVLIDSDHDGHAEQVITAVEHLNIPLGVFPIPGGVVAYSIPSVCRYRDTDGDGKADAKDELYATFGAVDTHGMVNSFTRGLDGWLYACHGYSNTSSPKGSDNQPITMNSGNTFRMRLDGSHLEYFTHGQVNPFGLAFDPLGNLYSADCHTLPVYMLLRGAYYPSFGKAHDGLDFGPPMMNHDHGSTAIGGIAYYAALQFPPEYRETVYVGNPVTGRVNHDRLEPHGSTYRAIELPDFISCDDPWFRPVNLQIGPDGAMYIADFYNRIIGHYEVPLDHPGRDRERGRIWRVVYTGKGVEAAKDAAAAAFSPMSAVPPANISTASLARLVELLGDANLTVRTQATNELVDRFNVAAASPARELVASPRSSAVQRAHALWVLERCGGIDRGLVDRLAADPDRLVRAHLLKAMAERRSWDPSLAELVRGKLKDEDAFVRRSAADALGRHANPENIKPLLELWATTPADDTHLVHVVRMAMRDQLLKPGVYASLSSLIGNDPSARERIANVSLGAPTPDAAAFLWQALQGGTTPQPRDLYLHHVVRHIAPDKLPVVFSFALGLQSGPLDDQLSTLRAVKRGAQERGVEPPPELAAWAGKLATQLLGGEGEPQVRAGIELAREFSVHDQYDQLAKAAGGQAKFSGLRPAAIDACLATDPGRTVALLNSIVGSADEPFNLRQIAAAGLARMNTDAARSDLLAHLGQASERLATDIASALCDSPAGAELLLQAVAAGKTSPRLLQEPAILGRLRGRSIADLDKRLAELTAGLPPQDQQFRERVERRRLAFAQAKPDAQQGLAIFKKSCAICHRINDEGAKIGPNLDGVGIRGLDRLLEDILDPNRNVDQAFRTTQIVTTDGKILTGLVLREEGKLIVLADAQGKEVRVPSDEVEERKVISVSPMPANIADQIPEAEFPSLLAYLLQLKQKAPAEPAK